MKQNSPWHGTVAPFARLVVLERHFLEVIRTGESAHLGVLQHLDAIVGLDPRDQVLRHRLHERAAPHDERHRASLLRHEDRSLPGRVTTADDDGVEPATHSRFELGRRVIDAGTLEAFEIFDLEPAIPSAGRDDDGTGRDLAAVGQNHHMESVLESQPRDLARRVEPGAEADRLNSKHGRRDRRPTRRSGSPRSSRCASSRRLGRPRRLRRARASRALPTRRRPTPPNRRGRCRPRRDRSDTRGCCDTSDRGAAANSPTDGLRSIAVGVTTTGTSIGRAPSVAR